jgi:hypothetical protein
MEMWSRIRSCTVRHVTPTDRPIKEPHLGLVFCVKPDATQFLTIIVPSPCTMMAGPSSYHAILNQLMDHAGLELRRFHVVEQHIQSFKQRTAHHPKCFLRLTQD